MNNYQILGLSTAVNLPIGLFSVVVSGVAPQTTSLLNAQMGVIIYVLAAIPTMLTVFLAVGSDA